MLAICSSLMVARCFSVKNSINNGKQLLKTPQPLVNALMVNRLVQNWAEQTESVVMLSLAAQQRTWRHRETWRFDWKRDIEFQRQTTTEAAESDEKFYFPTRKTVCFFKNQFTKKKKLKLHMGGWTATEEAVTDSNCAGDGRQQQSLYYRFFN